MAYMIMSSIPTPLFRRHITCSLLVFLAPLPAVGIEMRTAGGESAGETRRLLDVDPSTPVSSLGKLVQPEKEAGKGAASATWLTDCRVLEAGERLEGDSGALSHADEVGQFRVGVVGFTRRAHDDAVTK